MNRAGKEKSCRGEGRFLLLLLFAVLDSDTRGGVGYTMRRIVRLVS